MRHHSPALPNWDKICRKIVDGEEQRVKCRQVLEDSLGSDEDDGRESDETLGGHESSFFGRLIEGDPTTVAMVALPAAAILWYVYFRDSGAPQQVTTTS